jgi:hypothetical protein
MPILEQDNPRRIHMETLNNLVWYCPAIIMTLWTISAFVAGRSVKLGSRLPTVLSSHPVVFIQNQDENELSVRPKLWLALLVLFAGLLPVVSLVLVLSQAGCTLCSVAMRRQDARIRAQFEY